MAVIKIFNKEIDLNSDFFEMIFTFFTTFGAIILGIFHRPTDLPISLLQYFALCTLFGFVTGFILSNSIVWLYKEYLKKKNA